MVGGIGIGNAVSGFVAGKTTTIATLKCLGAPTRLIFTAYLAQVLALAVTAAIVAALLILGALIPAGGALRLLAGVLPMPDAPRPLSPPRLAIAASRRVADDHLRLLTLWPLAARSGACRPAALFR